jgi:hypothetical protein
MSSLGGRSDLNAGGNPGKNGGQLFSLTARKLAASSMFANHSRLSKLYAWEEKKSKTSWGAETVDYEKIAAAGIQGMKAEDLHRFLVVCALVSDLYCPGYNPRESLAKDSNLARTAMRVQGGCRKDSYICPSGTV